MGEDFLDGPLDETEIDRRAFVTRMAAAGLTVPLVITLSDSTAAAGPRTTTPRQRTTTPRPVRTTTPRPVRTTTPRPVRTTTPRLVRTTTPPGLLQGIIQPIENLVDSLLGIQIP